IAWRPVSERATRRRDLPRVLPARARDEREKGNDLSIPMERPPDSDHRCRQTDLIRADACDCGFVEAEGPVSRRALEWCGSTSILFYCCFGMFFTCHSRSRARRLCKHPQDAACMSLSMGIIWPEIDFAASEARKTASAAMSFGSSSLLIDCTVMACFLISSTER